MPASPYQIAGTLPWGGGGGNIDFSGSPAGLQQSFAGAYNSALAQNQSNYNNILSGYQKTIADQMGAQGAITSGYNQLYNTVIGGIQGSNQANQTAIGQQYARQSGTAAQQLIDRGLGNTTVQQSVQRGISLDEAQAQTQSANQFAQLQAGFEQNLGLAGLGYQAQACLLYTSDAADEL